MEAQMTDGDASRLHLGCGDDYRDGWLNVDANTASAADVIADVTDVPWSFADETSVSRIEAHHLVEHLPDRAGFFRECVRVLSPGGTLTVTVPLGTNAKTDHDHVPPHWTHETPEQYSRPHRRPWDPDLPLALTSRDVRVWLGGPFGVASPLLQAAARRWPAWAAERCYGGELTASYRRLHE